MSDLAAPLNLAILQAIAGPAPAKKAARQLEILKQSTALLSDLMGRFDINTELRMEHFLSQLAHETDSFCTTEEYASGAAYEGRADLGNVTKGDGVRFKGRGLIQLTGRANHRAFTRWMRSFMADAPDFEATPYIVEDFPWAVWAAIWFWTVKKLNVLADRDDVIAVTKVINGGRNGLDDRTRRLALAKRKIVVKSVLLPAVAAGVSARQNGFAVLYRGVRDREEEVAELQRLLKDQGFYHLGIDGDFAAGTDQAVRAFQKINKLKVDGLVGSVTWTALLQLSGADA